MPPSEGFAEGLHRIIVSEEFRIPRLEANLRNKRRRNRLIA